MSVTEFGPRSRTTFMSTLPQMRLETQARRYEASWHSLQSELELKSARLQLMLDITNSMVAHVELNDLLREVTIGTRRLMQSDFAILALLDSQSGLLRVNASEFADDSMLDAGAVNSFVETLAAHVFSTGKPWTGISAGLVVGLDLNNDLKWAAVGFKNGCCILPLVIRDRVLGILALGKREKIAYTQDEIDFLTQVSGQMAIAVESSRVLGELRKLKDNFSEERVCLEDENGSEPNFELIVGRSPALRSVLRQVEVVAPTDSSVLIQGETGTGKELIAQAIHNLSTRRDRPFVKLNCAAIPAGLLESELFGHEKGAFTGAIMRKPGHIQVADTGTLFLDEVGDIPPELQPKLLRVLQDHEFERLGSTQTQRVDVRVIAATNTSLAQMVAEKKFRSDLYYRLNVFPINVPPLRDRRDDIPLLVHYFANKYARRMGKQIES